MASIIVIASSHAQREVATEFDALLSKIVEVETVCIPESLGASKRDKAALALYKNRKSPKVVVSFDAGGFFETLALANKIVYVLSSDDAPAAHADLKRCAPDLESLATAVAGELAKQVAARAKAAAKSEARKSKPTAKAEVDDEDEEAGSKDDEEEAGSKDDDEEAGSKDDEDEEAKDEVVEAEQEEQDTMSTSSEELPPPPPKRARGSKGKA